MLVDFSHRAETKAYSPDVYGALAERLCALLAELPSVDAIVLCGSLIKDTLVSGWSDLDIIAFFNESASRRDVLRSVRAQLQQARGDVLIGIGVDVVFSKDFKLSNRLGGRPLAMTFEVAGYGQLVSGASPFVNLPRTKEILEAIEYDRKQAIRAELHNWRRAYVKEIDDVSGATDWLARCIKTALKLLKYETDPNFDGPYTYDAALARATSAGLLPEDTMGGFQAAVAARKNWTELARDRVAAAQAAAHFTSVISAYPEPGAT